MRTSTFWLGAALALVVFMFFVHLANDKQRECYRLWGRQYAHVMCDNLD